MTDDRPSIAELQRIEATLEPAPWDKTGHYNVSNAEYDIARFESPSDAAGVAALRNATPALLEIVAAALEWEATVTPLVSNDPSAGTRERAAERAFLAALSKVRR